MAASHVALPTRTAAVALAESWQEGLEPPRGLRGAGDRRALVRAAALPGFCGTRRSTASRCPGPAPSM